MGIFRGTPPPSCPSSRHCAEWARTYLKYCLCSTKDGVALGLGLASVLSWGVAEVPQIITNYKQKSTEGLSIAFLMTWIVGDLFNLAGCFLEPATLPTQFYMALLYTITTMILTGQTIYYSHIYRLKVKKTGTIIKPQKHQRGDASLRQKLLGHRDDAYKNNIQSGVTIPVPSSPIQLNTEVLWQRHGSNSPSSDYYYVSARSLSSSPVPIAGTWLGNNRQATRASPQMNGQDGSLVGEFAPAQSAPAAITKNSLSVVPWVSILLGMCVLHILVGSAHRDAPNEIIIPVGRKLLALADGYGESGSEIGSFLGWAMAVIYMGGRLPQIYLNMQRGHAEGLNPLMFTFALVGNTTYVGSILVNSMDWARLRPNLPWLVDAGGCVLLDSLIILQFLYFHYRKQKFKFSSPTKDLKLPASLEMIVHVDWKAGLCKSHIPCGTQFKCLVGGERAAAPHEPRCWYKKEYQHGRILASYYICISYGDLFLFLWYLCFEVGVYNLVVIIGC